MKINNQIIITILITMMFSNTEAQQKGTVNRGAYKFTIPEGWAGQELEGNFMMGSYNEPGMILIVENPHNNIPDLKNEIKAGLTDNYSYDFNILGDIQAEGDNTVRCDFDGTLGGEKARGHLAGIVNPDLGGLLIIAMTTPELYTQRYVELASEIAASLSVIKKPQTVTHSGSSSSENSLAQRYSDVKLTYMNSYYSSGYTDGAVGGGYSDREEISLCSSGYFTFNSSYESSAGGNYSSMYGQGRERGDGTWVIKASDPNQGILELKFNNGNIKQYRLEVNQKGETYLDGYRYYRTTGADGPEYAPVCN